MGKELEERQGYDELSPEEHGLVLKTIYKYFNEMVEPQVIENMRRELKTTDKKIKINDKKIEFLLWLVDYFDPSYGNGDRLFVEAGLSILAAAQAVDLEGFSVAERGMLCLFIFGFSELAFYGIKQEYNDKILNALYKKLDKIARENGKLKGVRKELEPKVTYIDSMKDYKFDMVK